MKSSREIIEIARKVISIEKEAVAELELKIGDEFAKAIEIILSSKGRVILAGVGKSANIASKIVATFNSTGQPAVFLHAADAIHGDLGNIQPNDVVVFISKSGNTAEIKQILPLIQDMGNQLIAITGNSSSFLAKEASVVIDTSVKKEACPYNLAPTSSTTAQLVVGDALAVCLLEAKQFTEKDFARFHPGGTLGKRLTLRVLDLLEKSAPQVLKNENINQVIVEISQKRLGATAVLDGSKLVGIITDGDLRRMLESGKDITELKAADIMTVNPKKIGINELAYDALKLMESNNISQLLVLDGKKYVGAIHIHDILKEGIV